MQDSSYVIFLIFGLLWVVMGVAGVIALLKLDGQQIKFGKWGLLVALPIVIPFVITLIYQIAKPFIVQHLIYSS